MMFSKYLNVMKKNSIHTFNVLSHDPVMRQLYGALTQWQVLTGASWTATNNVWLLIKSQHFTCLSVDAITTLVPSSLQQASKTGIVTVCIDLSTVLPLCSTSQHRTWHKI